MSTKTKNTILVSIVTIIASLIPAIICGKYIEAIFFFFCHWFIREQFPLQYHHIVPAMCRTITAIIMFFGISFMLPLSLSLISAIPICYFISWVGFVKKQNEKLEVKCNELEEELESMKIKFKETPKEEFIIKCQKANLGKRDTEIAIKYFIDKQKPKEIWMWLCQNKEYDYIEWDSIHQLLWRISNKLNKV